MKTGLKFVILVWPVGKPEEVQAFSTYRMACLYLGINYNSFNHWKQDFVNDEITLKGFVITRKEILKENACPVNFAL